VGVGGAYFEAIKTGHLSLGKMVDFIVHFGGRRGSFSIQRQLK